MRAQAYQRSAAEKKFVASVDYSSRDQDISSASGWSSICEMLCGFTYDVVNAVLAADADDVVDAVARARSGEAGSAHA